MDTLQAGITAAREGRRQEAQALLQQALQTEPRSEQGWLWMSAVVQTDAERRICLERVLTINPNNQTAKAGLEKVSSAHTQQDGSDSYLPISRSSRAGDAEPRQAPVSDMSTVQVAAPPSPHSMPTLGIDPVVPSPRPIQRLEPQPASSNGLAQLRAAQFQLPSAAGNPSFSESDSFMALVLIGGLSITALAGALMLGVLWLIGWPP
jgi:hypothetical protein